MNNMMDRACEELCKSIKNNKDTGRWVENVHTLEDTESGIRYWIGIGTKFDVVSSGGALSTVFNSEQTLKLEDALESMRNECASIKQQEVINSTKNKAAELDQATENLKQSLWNLFVFSVGVFSGWSIWG